MGHPLFERVGKRLVLTEAGHISLDYADTVFQAGDELMSTLEGRPLASRQVLRVGFDRLLDLAGIRPIILAEVDDMAMLRLLAREREGVTLVPPIVVRDELDSGVLVEHCRIPQLTESFYAIIQNRRFPNALLADLLTRYVGTAPNPVAS